MKKTYLYVPFKPCYDEWNSKNLSSSKTLDHYRDKYKYGGADDHTMKRPNPNVMIYPGRIEPRFRVEIERKYKHGLWEKTSTNIYAKNPGGSATLTRKPTKENQPTTVTPLEGNETHFAFETNKEYPEKQINSETLAVENTERVRSLTIVKRLDTLAIEGHGMNKPMPGLSDENLLGSYSNDGSHSAYITAVQLAQMLKDDGLPTNHILIKLNSCYGGGPYPSDNFGFNESFANSLALALGALNYNDIIVSGAQGKLVGQEYTVPEKAEGHLASNRANRRYWNAKGAEQTWTDVNGILLRERGAL
jgi:hypothetical protein